MPNRLVLIITLYLLGFGNVMSTVNARSGIVPDAEVPNGDSPVGFYLMSPLDSLPHNLADLKVDLNDIVREGIDSLAFPGAQLFVMHQGSILLDTSYGYHTYEKRKSVSVDDVYDLASVTKVAAAVPALMMLIDQGLLHLDDRLCDQFDFLCHTNKENITFRQALAHYGKLIPYIVYWQNTLKKNGKYRARTFRKTAHYRYPIKVTDSLFLHHKYKRKIEKAIKKSDLLEEKEYVYSGLMFLLVPDLVKRKTGLDFDEFLYKHIYEPLGADLLRFNPMDHVSLDRIVPTEMDTFFRHQQVHGTVHDEAAAMLHGVSGNAGLFGNARDLAKLCQLYLQEGRFDDVQLIDSMTVRVFTQCAYCEEGNRRGLGFDKPLITYDRAASYVARSASRFSYGHSGFTGTFFWVDPLEDLIFVFFSNRVYPFRSNRKLYSMGIRPRLHQAVYDYIDANKKGNSKVKFP